MPHAHRASFRTAVLPAAFAILSAVAGALAGGAIGSLMALGLLAALAMGLWLVSQPVLLRASGATVVHSGALAERVTSVAARAGIAAPLVAVSPYRAPNALAARTAGGAIIVVTAGLLEMLPPAELDAVLAHEIAHLRLPGRTVATILAVAATPLGLLAIRRGGASLFAAAFHARRQTTAPLAGASAVLAAALVRLPASRRQELEADATAATLVGGPAALLAALRRVHCFAGRVVEPVNPALSHLLFAHPFSAPAFDGWLNAHPSLAERLQALEALEAA